ncbi:MAG: GNAT family N-acetyltransferase [bacterium]|nr:GNAT family N-acetyltransferase [bacterium]
MCKITAIEKFLTVAKNTLAPRITACTRPMFSAPKPPAGDVCKFGTFKSAIADMQQSPSLYFTPITTNEGKKVGRIIFYKSDNLGMYGKHVPENWITMKDGEKAIKPFYWISGFEINQSERGKGLGKETIKRLVIQSMNDGMGGRIACETAYGSYNFYNKLGFTRLQNTEALQNTLQKRITKLTDKIKTLELDPSKKEELEIVKTNLQSARQGLEDVPKKLCREGDTIIFDPTLENLQNLFG